MTEHTSIDAETMRNITLLIWTPDGSRVEKPGYDLRDTPVGDKAEVWKWNRLVYPGRRQQGRRVREYVTTMYCAEGWHGKSGSADNAWPATCSSIWDDRWKAGPDLGLDHDRFHGFHVDHPVVWRVAVRRFSETLIYRWCDAELPGEYRPAGSITQGGEPS